MDVREKLVELLNCYAIEESITIEPIAESRLVDFLINHGVTVQECGYWLSYQLDEPYGCMDDKEWYRCSKCGKDARGRCYDDEWYSAPILSAYCPHCGVKMMSNYIEKKTKGEIKK